MATNFYINKIKYIINMKKFILFFILLGLISCNSNKLTPDNAAYAIMTGEQNRLPLVLQTLSAFVDNITLDSVKFLVDEEPMQGHLYTTWTSGKNSDVVIVQVDSVCLDKNRKDYVVWRPHCDIAAETYLINKLIDF